MRIKYEVAECSECHLPKLITDKGRQLCTGCSSKRKTKLYSKRTKERAKKGEKVDKTKLSKFFKWYWETHPNHVCFETGEPLYQYKSWHIHHLIEKEDRLDLAEVEDNIIYLSLEQHSLWHSLATDKKKADKMPKTFEKYVKIKQKYDS